MKLNPIFIRFLNRLLPSDPSLTTATPAAAATNIASVANFEKLEEQRKTRLVQTLSVIIMVMMVEAILGYFGFWLVLNLVAVLTGVGLSVLLAITMVISFRLAGAGHYRLAARLVVGSVLLFVLYPCWMEDTQTALLVLFMLPLALAITLLDLYEVLGVAAFIILAGSGWYLNFHWLRWYSAVVQLEEVTQTASNILIIVLVIPTIVALLVAPARSQIKAMRTQNSRLREAFGELEARQHTGQVVSQQVLTVAAQLTSTATQQASGSQEQTAVIIQVDSSLSELSATATHIAELAEQVRVSANTVATDSAEIEETTDLTARQSERGLAAVKEAVNVTGQSAILYEQLLDTMYDLNDKSARLKHILDLLSSIAGETHLLALNAAIEAASAGEYGSRFGVIAQEVKRLAQRSTRASGEVLEIINEIEGSAHEAVKAAQAGYSHSCNVEEIALRTGSVIEEMSQVVRQAQTQANSISQTSHSVKELTQTIWAATAQQRTASEQVLEALRGLSVVAEQNAEGSSFISTTALELEGLSQHLNRALVVAAH